MRIDIGRRHLSVTEHGARADPVILVHSSGLGSRQWRRTLEALSGSHRVIVPDLIGYGDSSVVSLGERVHFEMDLLALERLIDTTREPVHLVGHSYGGLLALLAALHRPATVRSVSVYEAVAFGVLRSEGDDEALATLPSAAARWPTTEMSSVH